MLNPSRPLVISLALAALVLGLATDIDLFGWGVAVLLALYLGAAGVAGLARRGSSSARTSA